MVDGFTEQSCSDNEDSTMKEPVVGTSARSEQLERIEAMSVSLLSPAFLLHAATS